MYESLLLPPERSLLGGLVSRVLSLETGIESFGPRIIVSNGSDAS